MFRRVIDDEDVPIPPVSCAKVAEINRIRRKQIEDYYAREGEDIPTIIPMSSSISERRNRMFSDNSSISTNLREPKIRFRGEDLFFVAFVKFNKAEAEALLKEGIDINFPYLEGQTALHMVGKFS
ncbi:hypothetical protein TNCT_556691 [Trichonephila clavata]|uniref:Ankyrin repeat protein n=1 Tax=Trichonephila clavata TaxID=2740835 RepID=A0A8X6HQ25_TRICU|nr:hypothetical protein TNCT_556691 [Trichonephila clavata]